MPTRTYRQFVFRVILAGAVAIAAYFFLKTDLARAYSDEELDKAHEMDPRDGQISAYLAERLMLSAPTGERRATALALARSALRNNPTAVEALVAIGMDAEAHEDTRQARRVFRYSAKLSRRDIPTLFWQVQEAVRSGTVDDALRAYDLALRSSTPAQSTMFPVLATAVNDANIRSHLLKILVKSPPWRDNFLSFLASNWSDPQAAIELFADLARGGIHPSDETRSSLLSTLIAKGDADQAWAYYASLRSNIDRRYSRDAAFAGRFPSAMPFDWTMPTDTDVTTSIQNANGDGFAVFSASPGMGGVALRQFQALPPGEYEIRGKSSDVEGASEAPPYWTIACVNGREVGRFTLSGVAGATSDVLGTFRVPSGCSLQTLSLVIQPSDAFSGVSGRVTQVSIQPKQ